MGGAPGRGWGGGRPKIKVCLSPVLLSSTSVTHSCHLAALSPHFGDPQVRSRGGFCHWYLPTKMPQHSLVTLPVGFPWVYLEPLGDFLVDTL